MGSRQLRFHTLTLPRLTGGTCHLEGPATWGHLPPGGTCHLGGPTSATSPTFQTTVKMGA